MYYKIPLFDLNYNKEEEKAIIATLRTNWISTGPKTVEFENKFAEMLNIKHSVALTNCTSALHLALKVLDIKQGDEVICPSLTFVATANSIRYLDAIPIFADIKSYDDLTIDPEEIEKKITNKTKAIIVMHYGGYACDMENIVDIAKKNNLKIIEDACHAPLSEYKGIKIGTIGDIGCFSFFANKNISTGEGGMLVTNDEDLFNKVKLLRSHGMTSLSYERADGHSTSYDVVDLGFNYRFDDLRASIGIVQLEKIKKDLSKRAKVRKWYVKQLSPIKQIIIPFLSYNDFTSNYIFPIILTESNYKKRDKIRSKLAEKGIQTSVHYPSVHRFSVYRDFYQPLHKTEYASDNLITLPMYGRLNLEDINFIAETFKDIIENN